MYETIDLALFVRAGNFGEIDDRHFDGSRLLNVLDRQFILRAETGAERFVAGDDMGEGLAGSIELQRAAQAQDRGDIISGAVWIELVQEPEPLLRERERDGGGLSGFLAEELFEEDSLLFRGKI